MPRAHARLLSVLLATAACTQQPVEVSLRGHEDFSQGSVQTAAYAPAASSYSAYAPAAGGRDADSSHRSEPPRAARVDQSTAGAVRIDSVGVSDLPPPVPNRTSEPARPAIKEQGRGVELKPLSERSAVKKTSGALIWPVRGKVVSKFGPKGAGKINDGITIAAREGEEVRAAAGGEVVFIGDQLKGYGNMVLIRHADGRHTTYAHLKRIDVSRYDRVEQGDAIGMVGAGNDARPQLYFAVRKDDRFVDPEQYLSSSYASLP